MSDKPTDSSDEADDDADEATPDKPRSPGLRGLAERYPSVVIFLLVFGTLGGLIALQTCTS